MFFKNCIFVLQMGIAGACLAMNTSPLSQIIVIVNGESITHSQLEDRIQLISLINRVPDQEQKTQKIKNEILKSLIDEKIQLHAAKVKKIQVSDHEIEKILQSMAKDNHMTDQQFIDMLSKNRISKGTLVSYIKAQMVWARYIRQKFSPLAYVSDTEVDQTVKTIEKTKNQKKYLLSEIILPFDSSEEQKTRKTGGKILSELKSGGNFGILAQKFSKSPSSIKGGDLGWLTLNQVDPAIALQVQHLKSGEISGLLQTQSSFKIIQVRDIQHPGQAPSSETMISFCQAFLPLKTTSSSEDQAKILPQVEELVKIRGCDNFKKKLKEYNIPLQNNTNISFKQLPDPLKGMLNPLSIGQCSEPVMTENGLLIQMVCEKKIPELALPNNDQIRDQLEQEKMSKQATRELRHLKERMYIEFKDPLYASLQR